jgi:hypothetical protein
MLRLDDRPAKLPRRDAPVTDPVYGGRGGSPRSPRTGLGPPSRMVSRGDVGAHSAVVWSATDRSARMIVEYSTTEAFANPRRVVGPAALPETGHYYATHLYDPARAQFTEFEPFYEFVSGPLHAGGFGPAGLDNTFGPQVLFTRHPGGRVKHAADRGRALLRPRAYRRPHACDDRHAPRPRRSRAGPARARPEGLRSGRSGNRGRRAC